MPVRRQGRSRLTLPSPARLAEAAAVLAGRLPLPSLRTPRDVRDRNRRRYYAEAFWTAILSAAAAFNGAFAVRLGASTELIGILSSAPALVAVALTLPSARLVEASSQRVRLAARSLLGNRFGYLLIALLPFVVTTGRAEAFVGLLILMTVPASLFGVTFNSTFADVVPDDRRALVLSGRNIIASGTVMALTPLIGRWLDLVGFPTNYQAAYFVGFLASLLGIRALSQLEAPVREPRPAPAREPAAGRRGLRQRLAAARRLVAENSPFARIVLDTLVHGTGAWLVAPLYIIYYVRVLGATDGWIGTLTAVANLSAAAGFYVWRRVIGRLGEDLPLRVTTLVTALYPLLVGLFGDLSLILVFAGLNGLISPGLSLSHFNTLLRVCPEDRRPTFFALYTTIMNAGAFVCPLIGVALAGRIGISPVLFIGSGVWMLGGVLFWLLPVRPKPRVGSGLPV